MTKREEEERNPETTPQRESAPPDADPSLSFDETARLLREISEETFEETSLASYRNFVFKNTLKGLALGFICDSYVFGKPFFVYMFQLIYTFVQCRFHDFNQLLGSPPSPAELWRNFQDPELIFIGSLILLSCIVFGFWDGWREDRLRLLALRDRRRGERLLEASRKLARINRSLERLAVTDDLTGLFNRRFALQHLTVAVAAAERYARPLSLMMIDIDHFKDINDTYGHEVGDMALARVAKDIRSILRDSDVVCRYGGEEFLVILPDVNVEQARIAAGRILSHFSDKSLDISGMDIPLTVSIGLTGVEDEFPLDCAELVRQADMALYKAKREGRNRVCVFTAGDREEFVEVFTFQPESRLVELSSKINELRSTLRETALSTIQSLINVVGTRDESLMEHMRATAFHARYIAVAAGLREEDVETVFRAALLHDIGKLGIPDSILLKPGPLDKKERRIIERHPELGARILAPLGFMRREASIIKAHHERYDGLGYPDGLSGDLIPFEAAILAVANAFAFMTASHPFKEALSEEEAVSEIVRQKGKQFHPLAVEALLRYRSDPNKYARRP